ncbi:hypothetical protein CsSME_00049851 [Camellia sinensis var. sinensis]
MKVTKGKHPEPFWPSIVMKKWLNIKPKVYDFSEDEVDTETESEDDGAPSLTSHTSRHRRGKSETLRLQYINTKDVRVTIGTWNVAGRRPYDNLDIDEWLCMKEPADIYILGFQEVVPLNAGNVLGAETRRPIPKWESIIRRTLNRSMEPKTTHKSCSAPPSPVLRTSSAADILADEIDDPAFEMLGEGAIGTTNISDLNICKLNDIVGMGKKLQFKRIYGIDSDGRLDWPEQSLDTTPQVLSSMCRLRRVFSSSARVGSDWMENPLVLSPQEIESTGLKRSHRSSGNLGLIWMHQFSSNRFSSDQFSEEEDDSLLEVSEVLHGNGLPKDKVKSRPKYVRIVSKQMVGIYVSVWVRRRLRRHINNVKVSPVGVGIMGYMGNKGSVSVSMSLFQTQLCFVCSHLTSGQKDGDEQRRNSDVHEIMKRTCFSSVIDFDQPQTIPAHDQIFWFGDLNYRLNMLDAEVRKLVAEKQWDELLNSDQLSKELRRGRVFDGWKEGSLTFPPTYKYEINSDRYAGENAKEAEKKRSPACSYILGYYAGVIVYYGKGEV